MMLTFLLAFVLHAEKNFVAEGNVLYPERFKRCELDFEPIDEQTRAYNQIYEDLRQTLAGASPTGARVTREGDVITHWFETNSHAAIHLYFARNARGRVTHVSLVRNRDGAVMEITSEIRVRQLERLLETRYRETPNCGWIVDRVGRAIIQI